MRKDVDQLVAGLKAIPGIHKVTLTTNGILLARQLPALLDAGLDSVNISLDTLRPEVFQRITARDGFSHVMEGLRAALDSGIPVKLNCVPQAGVNEGELEDLAALAENRPLQVRFIGMMAAMPETKGLRSSCRSCGSGLPAAGRSSPLCLRHRAQFSATARQSTTPSPAGRVTWASSPPSTASSVPLATGCG